MKTYGSARLEGGQWILDLEPQVAARIKRLLPRAAPGVAGALKFKNTLDVCRDLKWITERYPLAMNDNDRAQLVERSERHERQIEDFDSVMSGRLEAKRFDLALPPRDYQRIAADLALRTRGLLLADDIGLGKTVSAICMLTDPSTRPALVVTLTHLPEQWEDEIKRFAPALTTHIVNKARPYKIRLGPKKRKKKGQTELEFDDTESEFPDVLIMNYHKLQGWRGALKGVVRSVIFDEVQELRRTDSDKSNAARAIAAEADYRLGLTATPIYNYGIEFFNVISVLQPDALGTHDEFIREWCGASFNADKANIKNPVAFGAFLREQGLMLRRTRAEVGRELPPLTKVPHYVDCDPKAIDDVAGNIADLAKFILSRGGSTFDRMKASGELDWRLRQATGIAKAPYVAEFVKMLVESGEKVVLYGWHHEVYSIWMDKLRDYKPVLYTGEQSTNQKSAAKQAFCNGDAMILIMSLRAGAGLDGLQHACRTVVFGELDWSPGVHEQCSGRPHRDGQPDPVMSYYLLSEEGSDPVIADVLGVKKAQIEGVVRPEDVGNDTPQQADPNAVRRLAEGFLRRQGITIPEIEH